MANDEKLEPTGMKPPSKEDHDLHVLLTMRQDGLKKPQAILKAYAEGAAGLHRRLGG